MPFWCYLLAYEKRRAIQNELPVLQYLFSFTPEDRKNVAEIYQIATKLHILYHLPIFGEH